MNSKIYPVSTWYLARPVLLLDILASQVLRDKMDHQEEMEEMVLKEKGVSKVKGG